MRDAYEMGKKPINKEDKTMNISETAHRNHEELWPDYKSKAKVTDPELIEVFDNFAFDEVVQHDTMDTKTRVMMILASTIGSQALTEFRMLVNAALNGGHKPGWGISPVKVRFCTSRFLTWASPKCWISSTRRMKF